MCPVANLAGRCGALLRVGPRSGAVGVVAQVCLSAQVALVAGVALGVE